MAANPTAHSKWWTLARCSFNRGHLAQVAYLPTPEDNHEEFMFVEVDDETGYACDHSEVTVTASRGLGIFVNGVRTCFWSQECTLSPEPGKVYCPSYAQIVRDRAALGGYELDSFLAFGRMARFSPLLQVFTR